VIDGAVEVDIFSNPFIYIAAPEDDHVAVTKYQGPMDKIEGAYIVTEALPFPY
jgi:hypothetical protein